MSALAANQEKQDVDLLLSNRQRIQAMPLYWLEILEIEIIARLEQIFQQRNFI